MAQSSNKIANLKAAAEIGPRYRKIQETTSQPTVCLEALVQKCYLRDLSFRPLTVGGQIALLEDQPC